jgi:hypothetical protein
MSKIIIYEKTIINFGCYALVLTTDDVSQLWIPSRSTPMTMLVLINIQILIVSLSQIVDVLGNRRGGKNNPPYSPPSDPRHGNVPLDQSNEPLG